jgi:hypothetical protein
VFKLANTLDSVFSSIVNRRGLWSLAKAGCRKAPRPKKSSKQVVPCFGNCKSEYVYLVSAIGERFGIVSTRIMGASVTLPVAIASSLALISRDGGLYEFLAIDPFWPSPARNHSTQSRRDIAKAALDTAHTAFELALIAAS